MLDQRQLPSWYRRPRNTATRREFLEVGTLAATYSLLWNRRSPSAQAETVVVIGAGMAGLACAADLRSRGHEVIVLEGRNRIGGRVWTDRRLGVAIDLGASWIEGHEGNPITELADAAGAGYEVTDFDDVRLFDYDGSAVDESTLGEISEGFAYLMETAEGYAEQIDRDRSYMDAIEATLADEDLTAEDERAIAWVLSQASIQGGADMNEISLWYTGRDDGFDGQSMIFPGGYDQVIDLVADGIDVRTGTRVERVQHGGNEVRVGTDQGDFEADVAVVTVPLGVLQRGAIEFSPALPDAKLGAIGRLEMGTLNKVALRFPRRFWPDEPTWFGYMAPTEDAGLFPVFLNWAAYTGAPALMGFTGGAYARALEPLSDEEVGSLAMEVLRTMFGSSIPDPVDGVRARWNSDPFAFGSYSHIPVGATDEDYDLMAEPVGDRLRFAGEATIRTYPATVHGAFLSGVREAEAIARR